MEEPELDPEQQAELSRRAKAYSRRKMAEERVWQRDLSRKIKLKVRWTPTRWRARSPIERLQLLQVLLAHTR